MKSAVFEFHCSKKFLGFTPFPRKVPFKKKIYIYIYPLRWDKFLCNMRTVQSDYRWSQVSYSIFRHRFLKEKKMRKKEIVPKEITSYLIKQRFHFHCRAVQAMASVRFTAIENLNLHIDKRFSKSIRTAGISNFW